MEQDSFVQPAALAAEFQSEHNSEVNPESEVPDAIVALNDSGGTEIPGSVMQSPFAQHVNEEVATVQLPE